MLVDLNCDLGEGEATARTRALFRVITSANVACGGHAGTVASMELCAGLAKQHAVHLGAHPGLRGGFGRESADLSPEELELLLVQQVGALAAVAGNLGIKLHHVKLHGALYHATEDSEPLARTYLTAMRRWWPNCRIYALAGGRVAQLARQTKLPLREEAFLDRGYLPSGRLVPRGEPGSLISSKELRQRLLGWRQSQEIQAVDGTVLEIHPATWCVHGDGPEALKIARQARRLLG